MAETRSAWSRSIATLRLLALAAIAATMLAPVAAMPSLAQEAAGDPPPRVQELLELLADPAVQDWLQRQTAASAATATTDIADVATPDYLARRIDAIRTHLEALVATAPDLPRALATAGGILQQELARHGPGAVLLLLGIFLALGLGAQWFYRHIARAAPAWIAALPLTTVHQRLCAVGAHLVHGIGMVFAFALGSVGAFLALSWPPLLREIVVGYLTAAVVLWLAVVLGRCLLAPDEARLRVLPMAAAAAAFWQRRLWLFVGWFAFGWVTIRLLDTLGMAVEARHLCAYLLGLGLLAIAIETIWRRPVPAHPAPARFAMPEGQRRRVVSWLLTTYAVTLWLLWVVSALPLFWFLVVALGLPLAIATTRRAANHLLRPPELAQADVSPDPPLEGNAETGPEQIASDARPGVGATCVSRGLRAGLIIGAALLLAWVWQIDLVALAASDTLGTRLLRGTLNAVVIVLAADFLWHVMKALIDRKLAASLDHDHPQSREARRRARLHTLLPILRNVLFIVLVVMAMLMALAALGIDIGPLVAGAGVIGVAVGFGAQTLVKDVISGMFYLLDDAFRVGEYIQSGSYKGTVESFSLRSVMLRHHRGPLYTVPFGELGAVQNMSRDWVIDKFTVGVTYDSDLVKARKLIKQIGADLAADPEFAPHIIETLKMQGVDAFGDYAIQFRIKMMTKPGEQFVIRRRAYAMIREAFNANGISFAFPTVTVAGGDTASAAVAQKALDAANKMESEQTA